jgi:hypothetical protein
MIEQSQEMGRLMKSIKIDGAVKDVYPLLKALKSATPPYKVLGVGVDNRCTYINLEDSEQRDPTDLAISLFPELKLVANVNIVSGIVATGAEAEDAYDSFDPGWWFKTIPR